MVDSSAANSTGERSPRSSPAVDKTPAPTTVAALDMGASAIRLAVAEIVPGKRPRTIEEASRGVLLGRDTFSFGAIRSQTLDAAIAAVEGFRHLMDGYGVAQVRAVATSAVREARNGDMFLDRIQARTGRRVRHHQRGRREPARVSGGARCAHATSGLPRLSDAAGGSRRRQHQPDAAAPRRAEPLGRVRARVGSAPPAAGPPPAQPRHSNGLAASVRRERHRGDPARDSAQSAHAHDRARRRCPLCWPRRWRRTKRTTAITRSRASDSWRSATRSSGWTRTALSSGSGFRPSRRRRSARRCSSTGRCCRRPPSAR